MDAGAIEALVTGRHGDPFSLLGPHGEEVRSFQPDAAGVEFIGPDGVATPLARAHPAGLFAGPCGAAPQRGYRLRITWPGGAQITEDPYAFGLLLGPLDLHLFAEGRHREMGRVFGAQAMTVEGVPGVRFALWAPNARRVSVVGEFNAWDGRRPPMRLRREAGVWELFIPRLAPGARYQYELLYAGGHLLPLKADPVALAADPPGGAVSRVADPAPFVWTDGDWLARRARAQAPDAPMSIYEVHAPSWWRDETGASPDWERLADRLIPYASGMGFTHFELLPVMEHPFGGSWG